MICKSSSSHTHTPSFDSLNAHGKQVRCYSVIVIATYFKEGTEMPRLVIRHSRKLLSHAFGINLQFRDWGFVHWKGVYLIKILELICCPFHINQQIRNLGIQYFLKKRFFKRPLKNDFLEWENMKLGYTSFYFDPKQLFHNISILKITNV